MSGKMMQRLLLSGSAVIVGTIVGNPATAQTVVPAGTTAGTEVQNTAQASYSVNGTAQTTSSNTATFVVDRKVNLTVVSAQAAATSVNFGQTAAVTTFTVTNNTNGTQDFLLAVNQLVPAGILTGTDNFDVTNVHAYVDVNRNGVYDPAIDTATYIDELPADQSRTVFIVGDVPSNNNNANTAQVGLQVVVAAGGAPAAQGVPLIPTPLNTINQDAEIDVVFADTDNDGLLGYDTLRNGQGWAYADYTVSVRNVALSITKSATILSDGISTLNPKALPGALVQYCLTVANATLSTAANNVALTDVIPANTSYVPGSLTVGGLGVAGACVIGGVSINDDGSTTGIYGGSYNATTRTVTASIPVVAGGGAVAAAFRVTIN